ncbi:MAG: DUF4177 domain-containing protein [Acidimicrobiales bacterium]|jgi:hypothetical protein
MADKWEYRTISSWEKGYTLVEGGNIRGPDALNAMLNDLGGLGWELVAIVDTGAGPTAVFKRPSTRVLGDFEGSWPVE